MEYAKSLIFQDKNQKSWHTKEWRELRNRVLKDYCEQCGSKEELTVQHMWHPQSYGDIKYRISSKYGQLVSGQYSIDEMVKDDEVFKYFSKNYKQELKECCPECGSCNLLIRKTMLPKYRCNKCKYNFEEVEKILYPKLIDDREIKLECNTTNKISFRHLKKKIYDEK